MKARFNWGTGIAILYGSFAAMMMVLVYKASSQDFHLVTKDYYEQAVNYQDHIDQVSHSNALHEKVNIVQDFDMVYIQFPRGMQGISGMANLYRSSDSKLDQHIAIKLDKDNLQTISLKGLAKGNWKLQIDWTSGGVKYYNEQLIDLK